MNTLIKCACAGSYFAWACDGTVDVNRLDGKVLDDRARPDHDQLDVHVPVAGINLNLTEDRRLITGFDRPPGLHDTRRALRVR